MTRSPRWPAGRNRRVLEGSPPRGGGPAPAAPAGPDRPPAGIAGGPHFDGVGAAPLRTTPYSHKTRALSVSCDLFPSRRREYRRTMTKTLARRSQTNPGALVNRILEEPALVSA